MSFLGFSGFEAFAKSFFILLLGLGKLVVGIEEGKRLNIGMTQKMNVNYIHTKVLCLKGEE